MSWNQRITTALQQRRENDLLRTRRTLGSAQGVTIAVDGQSLLNFCSNDYLGLASQGGEDLAAAARQWASGSGASHLVCGHSKAHHDLEDALAAHTGYPRALLFSTGYMANVGAISALAQRGDRVLQDKLNHASLLDGAILSRADLKRYRHADYDHLLQLLESEHSGETLIVSDSIFSMDGDLADVPHLASISKAHDALLMIDDAHGFGVLGDQGCGVTQASGLTPDDVPVYVGTLGKALGGYGAFVAGSDDLIEYLTQFARSYIYTTAMPAAVAQGILGNFERLKDNHLRDVLNQHIRYFRAGAAERGLPLMPSESPVQPLLIGDAGRAQALSQALYQRGIWVSAIRPPTVPQGSARLRITLTSAHTTEQIQRLLDALADLMQEQNV